MQRKALAGTTVLMALLALMATMYGDGQAIAGTAAPNVAGKWGDLDSSGRQRPDHPLAVPTGHQRHRQPKCDGRNSCVRQRRTGQAHALARHS
jgi:hypothetical protein